MSELKSRVIQAAESYRVSRSTTEALEAVRRAAGRRLRKRRIITSIVAFGTAAAGLTLVIVSFLPGVGSRVAAPTDGGNSAFAVVSLPTGGADVVRVDLAAHTASRLATLPPAALQRIHPDLAVTPSGDKIVIGYSASDGGERIDLLDAVTGKVIDSEVISDIVGTQLPDDYLAVSRTGRVYVYQSVVTGPGTAEDAVRTYDIASQQLLPESIPLGHCGGAGLLFPAGPSLVVVCDVPRQVHVLQISNSGSATSDDTLKLPPVERDGSTVDELTDFVIGGDVTSDGKTVYLVTQAGALYTIEVASRTFLGETRLPIGANSYVTFDGFRVSEEGDVAFVATGSTADFDAFVATKILSLSVGTWRELANTRLGAPASGKLVAAANGDLLVLDRSADRVVQLVAATSGFAEEVIPLRDGLPIDIEVAPAQGT